MPSMGVVTVDDRSTACATCPCERSKMPLDSSTANSNNRNLPLSNIMVQALLSSIVKNLLRCHNASLCPCRYKGLLPEMVADSSHCMIIVSPFNRLQGCTYDFAQRFRSPPKPRRPVGLSLHCYHARQSFKARGDQLLVAYLFRHLQALFVDSTGKGIVTPGCLHFP